MQCCYKRICILGFSVSVLGPRVHCFIPTLIRSQNRCMVNNVHTQKHAIHPLPRRPPQLGHIGGHGIDFIAYRRYNQCDTNISLSSLANKDTDTGIKYSHTYVCQTLLICLKP